MRTVVDAIGTSGRDATLTVAGSGSGEDTTLSWAELDQRAHRMAAVLAGHGIGPGSRVGLLGDTSASLVTAIEAVWLRGAAFTILPLHGHTGRQSFLAHLLGIIADARFDLLIVDERAGKSDPALSQAVRVISLAALEGDAAGAAAVTPVRPDPGDLAVLQYTSGSTRSPRGVPVTHGNLTANLDAIEATIGREAVDPANARWVSWLPLYHDMGLIGLLALPMSRGCTLILQSPVTFALRPASWLERLSRHRATVTGAPNFAYGLMAQLLAAGTDADLSSLRYMFSGGEPIDAGMMSRFTEAGRGYGLDPGSVVAAYGLAESTLAVSFARIGGGITVDEVDRGALERDSRARPVTAGQPARHLVRLGPPVPGTRIRITDPETGQTLGEQSVGEIEVSGPSVVSGYWGETPRPSGWLRTGDLGYLTGGDLVVCGRAKDVLFAAGRNVYPQDVEAAASAVPGVRPGGAAAFGIPAEHGDRLIVAVESRGADVAEVRRAVALAVTAETGMAPADVVTLRFGRLPKTSSGKLRRAETKRRYLAGELTGAGPALVERTLR